MDTGLVCKRIMIPNTLDRILISGTALIFSLAFTPGSGRAQDSGRIKPAIFDAVVQITTAPTQADVFTGTGFLATPSADDSGRIYLITNKHMIGNWKCPGDELSEVYDWIDVYFYRNNDPSGKQFRATRIVLKDHAGKLNAKKVFVHPDKIVDVVAIDVDSEIKNPGEHIRESVFSATYMVRFKDIDKQLTGVGDQVFALGYPLGISSRPTNHPIAKVAYLASTPGEDTSIPYICGTQSNGQPRTVTVSGKILIVDGLIVHGNSGSPVLLAGGTRVRHDPVSGQIQFSTNDVLNLVTGIVSMGFDGSGLSIVYSSDYIWDLLADASRHN
jgi:hypothetical protein